MSTYYFIPLLLLSVFFSGVLAGWKYVEGLTFSADNLAVILFLALLLLAGLYFLEKKKPKLYAVVSSFVASLYVAVISTSLYAKLPILSGSVTDSSFRIQGFVLLVCFFLFIFYKKIRDIAILFSLFFVLSDLALQVTVHKSSLGYFSERVRSTPAVFSKNKKNIVLIIIDTARADIFNRAMLQTNMDGLKVYHNYYSNFSSTFTSVPFNLSAINPIDLTFSEYSEKFVCNNIQSDLLKSGWEVYNFPYEYLKQTLPILPCNTSHIIAASLPANQNLAKKFWIAINVYMYKQNLGNVFGKRGPLKKAIERKSQSDDLKFEEMLNAKVSDTDKNVFAFYHFNGLHAPVNKKSSDSSVVEDYIARSGEIAGLIKQFVAVLKHKGVSSDTEIIVMGDHGTFIPGLSYSDVKIENTGSDTKIVTFSKGSIESKKISALYGDHLLSINYVDILRRAGLGYDVFKKMMPLSFAPSGYSSLALDLSRASLSVISLGKKGVSHQYSYVFTGFVRNFILGESTDEKRKGDANVVYFTPFSGNIDKNKIFYISKCSVNGNTFLCDTSRNPDAHALVDISMKKQESQGRNFVNISLYDYPKNWNRNCIFKPQLGVNIYPVDVLDCLHGVHENQIGIYPTFALDNVEISNVSVDSGGVRSMIGFDVVMKVKGKPDNFFYGRVASAGGGHAPADYQIATCSFNYKLRLPSFIVFEINDKMPAECNTIRLSNSNPLIPSLEQKYSKDARIINSQIVSVSSQSDLSNSLVGITYPFEDRKSRHLKWVAAFPFKVFSSICRKKIDIELYPSKTGEVLIKAYRKSKLIYSKKIDNDQAYRFYDDVCLAHPDFDEVIFSSQKEFFSLPKSKKVYAAKLHVS